VNFSRTPTHRLGCNAAESARGRCLRLPAILCGAIMPVGSYDHFLDTRAKVRLISGRHRERRCGGTVFLENPTLISRVHYDQFLRKLGGYKAVTGGYGFQYLTPTSNNMGALPQTLAQFYNPVSRISSSALGQGRRHDRRRPPARQRRAQTSRLRFGADSALPGIRTASPLLTSSIDPSTPSSWAIRSCSFEGRSDLPPHQIGMTIQVASGPPAGIMNEPW